MCFRSREERLVECEACKRLLSVEASACPGCGHPRVPASAGRNAALIRCVACNTPHAVDAMACPKCGQPHDPGATKAGIAAEREAERTARIKASEQAYQGRLFLVVAGGGLLFLCLVGQRCRTPDRVEYITVPDAELPAELPPVRHD